MATSYINRILQMKLVRYGLLGLISTGIHVLVAFIFIRLVGPSLFFSNLAGFFVAYHFSYYAQSKWVFDSGLSLKKSMKYLLVQLISLMLAILFSHTVGTISVHLKVILTAFVLPLITFFVHKVWTFSDKEMG